MVPTEKISVFYRKNFIRLLQQRRVFRNNHSAAKKLKKYCSVVDL